MEKKYETEVQLLLNVLIEKTNHDLALSNERLSMFRGTDAEDLYNVEAATNKKFKVRLAQLTTILNQERDSYISGNENAKPFVVRIGKNDEKHGFIVLSEYMADEID